MNGGEKFKMEDLYVIHYSDENYLAHYGTPRHSGRYPWGSGERPYQSLGSSGKILKKSLKSEWKRFKSGKFNSDSLKQRREKPKENLQKEETVDQAVDRIKTEYKTNPQYKTNFDRYLYRMVGDSEIEGNHDVFRDEVMRIALTRPKESEIPDLLEESWNKHKDDTGYSHISAINEFPLKDEYTKAQYMKDGEKNIRRYMEIMNQVDEQLAQSPKTMDVLSATIRDLVRRSDFVQFSGLYNFDSQGN